jgi:hypothetical protein
MSEESATLEDESVPWSRADREVLIELIDSRRVPGVLSAFTNQLELLLSSFICNSHRLHFSKASISELRPITFSEMRYPKVHTGFYCLCQTVTPPLVNEGLNVVVEDPSGNLTCASLYNVHLSLDVDPETWFTPGTIFAVKKPFM